MSGHVGSARPPPSRPRFWPNTKLPSFLRLLDPRRKTLPRGFLVQVGVVPSLEVVEEGDAAGHSGDGLDGRLVMSLPMALVKTPCKLQLRAKFGAAFPIAGSGDCCAFCLCSTVGSARERASKSLKRRQTKTQRLGAGSVLAHRWCLSAPDQQARECNGSDCAWDLESNKCHNRQGSTEAHSRGWLFSNMRLRSATFPAPLLRQRSSTD